MARFWWAALCVTVSAVFIFLVLYTAPKKRDALALSTVKVLGANDGHGSGVHIHPGNRHIITAAHVVGSAETVKIKTSRGDEIEADVLWTNKAHDIALLRARELPGVASARLHCEPTEVGQHIRAIGNPGSLEWVHAFGRVSSSVEQRGPWAKAYVAAMMAAPGMSGGPVIDARGRLVGIVVGVALAQIGWSPSPLALTYIVPGSAICSMLARNNA